MSRRTGQEGIMHRQSHHIVGLIEIDPREQSSVRGSDATLAATLARLAVCASADLEAAEAEEADDLEESLDGPGEGYDDGPLIGEPLRASAESIVADMPRLKCELSLLYTMVRSDALLRGLAAR
jgi:hypothetical protein